MWNIFSCDDEEKEDRSHTDGYYQYCRFCGEERLFIWDRCEVCRNN
ncbi:MAG: hypothetical protein ACRDA3_12950 [Peptostreptococcaceae bacterium]